MKPLTVELMLKLLSKVFLAFAFYSLFFILWEVAWGHGNEIFFAMTLQHWVILVSGLVFSVFLEVTATHPEVRQHLTHIERRPKPSKTMSDADALTIVLKNHPQLALLLKSTEQQMQREKAAAAPEVPEVPKSATEQQPAIPVQKKPNKKLPLF